MSTAFEKLHPDIQRVLWAMKWTSLRQLQVDAINSFNTGDNHLILSASTASGKTEAAFLPILSAIAGKSDGTVRAMYIGPLKALINDQFVRLEDLCHHAEIPVHKWHGDVSATAKKNFRKKPGGVLLITPESLESAFINYGTQVSRIFAGLEFVVIDELHAFVADVRGVHLKSLLARLFQAAEVSPRIFGLSATLADFETSKTFLDHHSPHSVEVIRDADGTRSIKVGIRAYPQPSPTVDQKDRVGQKTPRLATTAREASADLLSISEKDKVWKDSEDTDEESSLRNLADDLANTFTSDSNLIFTNSRALAEMLGDEMNQIAIARRWPRSPFLLHHGSLAKEVREDVELRLKNEEPLSVFCTSTLEMGIDIGNVRSVGQLGPPWSVASLVQRLGRSGRGEGQSAILRMYSLDPPPSPRSSLEDLLCPQLLRSVALIELMLEKWLEPFDNDPFHFSTLIHQTLSLLRQTGGCHASSAHQILIARGAFHEVSKTMFASLLRQLSVVDLIEQTPTGELILTPNGEGVTHRKEFYAAFSGTEEYSVRCGQTTLGKIPAETVPPEGEHLILNGRRWKVVVIDSKAMIAEVTPASGRKRPVFLGSGGIIHAKVVEKMRGILMGQTFPSYLHEDAANLLEGARTYAKRAGVFTASLSNGKNSIMLFPWTGTKGLETLKLCALHDGIRAETTQLTVTYHAEEEPLRQHLERVMKQSFDPVTLASRLVARHFDKFDQHLPDNLLDLSNSNRRVSLKDAATAAKRMLTG
ncbi:DEAD/DEAH box helicase [Luteolibacter sp. AS25]|uniref:DEAD/DEAH box helicase n=1 Tax=Luteolibacter sp. AS25 TaxID=3135776 RepID=UPI00398A710F